MFCLFVCFCQRNKLSQVGIVEESNDVHVLAIAYKGRFLTLMSKVTKNLLFSLFFILLNCKSLSLTKMDFFRTNSSIIVLYKRTIIYKTKMLAQLLMGMQVPCRGSNPGFSCIYELTEASGLEVKPVSELNLN